MKGSRQRRGPHCRMVGFRLALLNRWSLKVYWRSAVEVCTAATQNPPVRQSSGPAAGTCIQPERFWQPLQAFPLSLLMGGSKNKERKRGGTNNKRGINYMNKLWGGITIFQRRREADGDAYQRGGESNEWKILNFFERKRDVLLPKGKKKRDASPSKISKQKNDADDAPPSFPFHMWLSWVPK